MKQPLAIFEMDGPVRDDPQKEISNASIMEKEDEYETGDLDRLFTPYINEHTTVRAYLTISQNDMDRFDAIPETSDETVVVEDTISTCHVEVKRAACGLDCRCAAVIVGTMHHTRKSDE